MQSQNKNINVDYLMICMVIYELPISNSFTYQTLIKAAGNLTNLLVCVYDNSLESQAGMVTEIQQKSPGIELIYYHDKSNPGISKAYNKAAEVAKSERRKWLIFFDQDTKINSAYFQKLVQSINENSGVSMIVPITQSGKIISPSAFILGRAFIKNEIKPAIYNTKRFTIINSGLAITLEAFNATGGYDEQLPLDFSDHYFMSCFKKKYTRFLVFDCINNHDLSTFSDTDIKKVTSRFGIYFLAAICFSKKTNSFLPVFWAFLRAIKLSLRYKKLIFISDAGKLLFK